MHAVSWAGINQTGAIAECYLWSIERYQRQCSSPAKNVRAVVRSHMVVRYVKTLVNVYPIDTGGWKPGDCISFLELGSLKALSEPVQPKASSRNLATGSR